MISHKQNDPAESLPSPTLQEIERITRPAYERSLAEMREYWRNRFQQKKEINQNTQPPKTLVRQGDIPAS